MSIFRLLPRLVVVCTILAVPMQCDPGYSLSMVWPKNGQSYDSIVDGNVIHNDVNADQVEQNGSLPAFPCDESTADTVHLGWGDTINLESGFQFHMEATSPRRYSTIKVLGYWSADFFFGRFESSDINPDGTLYTWFPALERKYRVFGGRAWCINFMPIPLGIRTVGDGNGIKTSTANLTHDQLEGVYAVFAVRFNYFDHTLDAADAGFNRPVQVTTQCFRVQFSSTRFPSGNSYCNGRDNGVDTREEAEALLTPNSDASKVNKTHVGIGVGVGAGVILLLYCIFRWADSRRKGSTPKRNTSRNARQPSGLGNVYIDESSVIRGGSPQFERSTGEPYEVPLDQPVRLVSRYEVLQPPPPAYDSIFPPR